MGDVTIIPPLGVSDYANMLADPSSQVMDRYLTVGQRECWRKMPMLATRLRIAHALHALRASLADRSMTLAPSTTGPMTDGKKAATRSSARAHGSVEAANGSVGANGLEPPGVQTRARRRRRSSGEEIEEGAKASMMHRSHSLLNF